MSIKKKYLKNEPLCKVTFSLSKIAAKSARTVHLVGEFNNWDEQATPMKELKNSSFSVTLNSKSFVQKENFEKWSKLLS